ncbi:type IV secretory system conjugative DNA transfer family protein [Glycomyces tenuis]|uniref:type IV secretory system conjugative DNA transfer family protein n=1 Tax=Glycomyces tenuis TaxID=58116 RepID=UPI000420E9F0|nr:type VI secretion protein [Glycomyces tenuis]
MTEILDALTGLRIPTELIAWIETIRLPLGALVAGLACILTIRAVLARRSVTRGREGSHYVRLAAPPEVDPAGAQAAWRQLRAIQQRRWSRFWRGQPHLIWEYSWDGPELAVRIWVPSLFDPQMIVQAVTSAWPGTTALTEPARSPLPEKGAARGAHVVWNRQSLTPVEVEEPADLLRGLLEAGPAGTRGHAVLQVVASPVSRRQVSAMRRSAQGPSRRSGLVDELLSFVLPRFGTSTRQQTYETPWERQQRTALAGRLNSQMWNVGLRWVVGGPAQSAERVITHSKRLDAAVAGMLGWGHERRRLLHARAICNRWAKAARTTVLNGAELAGLAHLPTDAVVPALERAGARPVAPPRGLGSGGRNTKTLGTAAIGGRKVALSASDARYHLHVIGKTGSGKSTLLQHLALADIRDRRGLVLIDPAGDLVDDILARLDPETVAGRLYLIDPRLDAQPGLAPLAGADEHLVVENLVAICRNIWPRFWGPRADDVLRYGLLTLRENGQPLTMLPNLLLSKKFRRRMVAEIQKVAPAELPPSGLLEDGDMTGIPGYWAWYGEMNPTTQNQAAGPVLSRMRALLGRPFIRTMFDTPTADFDMADILDNGGIVLARLSKGEVGEDTARLVGSILVAKVWQAATARTATPERRRRDCSLILDEAQNFLNLPNALDDMLAEARKLHLSVTIAHQYLAQLPKEMGFAVSGQARSKLYFNTSPEDARVLARHTAPLSEHDLAHLDDYTMAARLYLDRREAPAFTLNGLPPAEEIGRADQIRTEALRRITKADGPDPASGAVTTAVHPGPFTQRLTLLLAQQRDAGRDAPRDDKRKPSSGHESGEAL